MLYFSLKRAELQIGNEAKFKAFSAPIKTTFSAFAYEKTKHCCPINKRISEYIRYMYRK
jgi:hypothetical protein